MTAPSIPPGAMPVAWQFAPAQVLIRLPDGSSRQETHVVAALTRPSGTDYYFFPPDAAEGFGKQIISQAQQARSGIIVAGQMPPDPPPNGRGPSIITP